MFVNSKQFQELIERLIRVETKNEALEKRIAVLEKNPPNNATKEEDEGYDAKALFNELLNGVPDKETGKVRWTDGR
jgi:hypothetical protein